MNKTLLGLVVIVIIGGIGIFFFTTDSWKAAPVAPSLPEDQSVFNGKNTTFTIDGKLIMLVNGISETEAAPGSASKIITRYFGNEARGDLNFDGQEDIAFLITQEGGGSGLFYYAVVALKTLNGYQTTNAFLIGDRIAPQSTNIIAAELHVNYAERKPGEPMTARPSVGVTLLLKVTPEGILKGLMQ